MQIPWQVLVAIFLLLCFIAAYLMKRFAKAQVYLYIISLWRTRKPLPLIKRLANKIGKPTDLIARLGIILGFGAIAVDFLYGRKMKRIWQRILLLGFSTLLLGLLFYFSPLGAAFGSSPLLEVPGFLMPLVFGLSGFAGFSVLALVLQGMDIVDKLLIGKKPCPGVAPVIPGVQVPNVPVFIPLHAWISLFIILVVHEGFHGIASARNKIRLKSSGLLLFGFLPIGAFVEPDEKTMLKKQNETKALKILAMGPTANLLSIIAFFAIGMVLVGAIALGFGAWAKEIKQNSFAGLEITKVDQNTSFCGETENNPAFGVLQKGMRLVSIGDKNVSSAGQASLALVAAAKEKREVRLGVIDDKNTFAEKTLKANSFGIYGFTVQEKQKPGYSVPFAYKIFSYGVSFFESFLSWLILLSLLVAIVNFLPVEPFDGGKMAKILLVPYFGFMKMNYKETKLLIGRLMAWIVVLLIIINVIPLFLP